MASNVNEHAETSPDYNLNISSAAANELPVAIIHRAESRGLEQKTSRGGNSSRDSIINTPAISEASIALNNNPEKISARVFRHYSPLLTYRNKYFQPDQTNSTLFDACLSVVICAFNESAKEICMTLKDLREQHEVMKSRGVRLDMHVCVILDGWSKAAKSTKQWAKQMFPVSDGAQLIQSPRRRTSQLYLAAAAGHGNQGADPSVPNWHFLVDTWDNEDAATSAEVASDTLILQCRTGNNNECIAPIRYAHTGSLDSYDNSESLMKITMLVKRSNRRKHNSHEWFLRGFAPVYTTPIVPDGSNPAKKDSYNSQQLVFMTDTGTRFHPSCLHLLVQQMLLNQHYSAVTGRQRVMTESQQFETEKEDFIDYSNPDKPIKTESEGYFAKWLRAVQAFEYDCCVISFIPSFSAFGMLPVIPGPCGVYRLDLLENQDEKLFQLRCSKELLDLSITQIEREETKQTQSIENIYAKLQKYNKEKKSALAKRSKLLELVSAAANDEQENHDVNDRPAKSEFEFDNFSKNPKISKSSAEAIEGLLENDGKAAFLLSLAWLFSNNRHLVSEQKVLIEHLKYTIDSGNAEKICHAFNKNLDEIVLGQWNVQRAQVAIIDSKLQTLLNIWENDNIASIQYSNFHRELVQHTNELCEVLAQQYELYRTFTSLIAECLFGSNWLEHPTHKLIICRAGMDGEEAVEVMERRTIEDLKRAADPLEFYFRCANSRKEEQGLMLASLLLAEDRVLSDAAVLKCDHVNFPLESAFVADALYYVQAETESEKFVQQRRRWTNGGSAAYVFTIYMQMFGVFERHNRKFSLFKQWSYWCSSHIMRFFWMMMQVIQTFIVTLTPSLLVLALKMSLSISQQKYDDVIVLAYFLFWTAFIWLHGKQGSNKLNWPLWFLGILLNGFVMIFNTYTLWSFVVPKIETAFATGGYTDLTFVICAMVVLGTVLPFVLALLTDIYTFSPTCFWPTSKIVKPSCTVSLTQLYTHSAFIKMIITALPFFFFLPSLAGFVYLYSYCRTWELTWGNRPSVGHGQSAKDSSNNSAKLKAYVDNSYIISGMVWGVNVVFLLVALNIYQVHNFTLLITVAVIGFFVLRMILSLLWLIKKLFGAPFIVLGRVMYRSLKRCLCSCCCNRGYYGAKETSQKDDHIQMHPVEMQA
jgi:cellulose synthase/poly-beta-1,6-N-acetylglucosamine synthase-like glycosyltransferase